MLDLVKGPLRWAETTYLFNNYIVMYNTLTHVGFKKIHNEWVLGDNKFPSTKEAYEYCIKILWKEIGDDS